MAVCHFISLYHKKTHYFAKPMYLLKTFLVISCWFVVLTRNFYMLLTHTTKAGLNMIGVLLVHGTLNELGYSVRFIRTNK